MFKSHEKATNDDLRHAASALVDWARSQGLDHAETAMTCLMVVSAIVAERGPDKAEAGKELARRSLDQLIDSMVASAAAHGIYGDRPDRGRFN